YKSITWSECTLRKYLNNEFINYTFNSNIIKMIKKISLENPDYCITIDEKKINTKGGPSTEDRVFCLSMDEVKKYFKNNNAEVAKPTDYCLSQVEEDYKKFFVDNKTGGGSFWLRTPGSLQNFAIIMKGSGLVNDVGISVDNASVGIRPALWLHLES
nr:DUF6273 domain-containing protein [Lachnospiraceae bacterium]